MSINQTTIEDAARQYYREIYWFCFSRMYNKNNVEDVVQNVFMTLQEKQNELTPEHLRAWLYSVAQKKLLEEKRDEVRRSRFVRYDDEETAEEAAPPFALAEESDIDVVTLKQRIIQMLSPQEQALFAAIYEKQCKRKDAAAQFGISENALNVRVHRLKKHIRDLIQTILAVMLFLSVRCR